MSNAAKFFALVLGTLLALLVLRWTSILPFNPSQMASLIIFSTFIYGTLLFGEFRLAFAFGGIAALLATSLLDIPGFTESANLKVIIFLVGMFLVIGYLEENQFFEHIVEAIVARVGPRPRALLLVLMIMGSVSAALVDEVTSILFMTGTMLHLTGKYKLNPIPFIIMLVFATNIGSAASSIGNPIGVMIALNAGFSFGEFLRWSAPIALVVNVATYFVCRWWYADSFNAFAAAVQAEHDELVASRKPAQVPAGLETASFTGQLSPALAVAGGATGSESFHPSGPSRTVEAPVVEVDPEARRANRISWIVFLVTISLLITHSATEHMLGRIFHTVRETTVVKINVNGNPIEHHVHGLPKLTTIDGKTLTTDGPLEGVVLSDGSTIKAIEWGLGEGSMMIGAALTMGCVVLLLRREKARELVERRVDWWTLTFFMMLFASVGTLEHTGVTRVIADKLIHATGDRPALLINIVGWATGWLSAFLDNVLAVATFMPVIHDVRVSWAALHPDSPGYPAAIYWLMLFGGTFMGNMTVIGSTANIIAVGMLEKRGHGTVKFGEWFKIGFIVSIVSMAIATVMLGAQTNWFTAPLLRPPAAEMVGQ